MSVAQVALQRLRHAHKTGRMYSSPEELDAVGLHLAHSWFLSQTPERPFEETFTWWRALGGPFAGDAEEHAAMRAAMFAEEVVQARSQVVLGFGAVWAELARHGEAEKVLSPHLEALLDEPERIAQPDLLNMVLFALMGLVAEDAQAYVEALGRVREKVGGHPLRPLHIVAPPGPTVAQLTYTRKFTSWDAVLAGLSAVLADLEARR
jgi:hypothetical protein